MASSQFLRGRGTRTIPKVAFVTAPIELPEESVRGTRPFGPERARTHYRFDPALSRRDGLVRVREAIAERQRAMATRRGCSVGMRLVLELDGLREAEHALLAFKADGLEIAARASCANVMQDISLLDPASPAYREDLFKLRQRLGGIGAAELTDDRVVATACMAIRVLDDAIRRLYSSRPAPQAGGSVQGDHAAILDEQRIHALVGLLHSVGRARLVGLGRERAEAVIQTFRRVDPGAFGFDPRNQRFVRHMADLIDRVSALAS
jgi:hypothetical protein